LSADIDEMLRAEKSHGEIREFLVSQNESAPARYALSRHAIQHLKLESRSAKKKQETDTAAMRVPHMDELRDEALKILYWRMKNRPDEVETREVVQVLSQTMRVLEPQQKPADDLASRLAQINDAYTNS
jgi:hypothetical protein